MRLGPPLGGVTKRGITSLAVLIARNLHRPRPDFRGALPFRSCISVAAERGLAIATGADFLHGTRVISHPIEGQALRRDYEVLAGIARPAIAPASRLSVAVLGASSADAGTADGSAI